MIEGQTLAVAMAIQPALVNSASATAVAIDTLGYDFATIYFHLGATDVALSALKLQESTASGSGYADISGGGHTAPGATDDNHVWAWEVNLVGRKRYLEIVATVGTGSTGAYLSAIAILTRAKSTPVSATDKGLKALVTL